jgi:hypothetical protein
MPRGTKPSPTDWGHAQRPDFLIPEAGAKRHDATANYFAETARHQRQAAKIYQAGQPVQASHRALLPCAEHLQVEQAVKDLLKNRKYSLIPILEF